MSRNFPLSQRMLTEIFWDFILSAGEERAVEREALARKLDGLEALRTSADYNTGSISFSSAWCIYNLVRWFQPTRVLEVGTFIGKSTTAIGKAMSAEKIAGEIYTCDFSNDLTLPWDETSTLRQFPRASSTAMLKEMTGTFDFLFLDGRVTGEDMPLIDSLVTEKTIIALDDFEGMEKGVMNLTMLMKLPKFGRHLTLYPASAPLLAKHGFTTQSLCAVMMPISKFQYTRQG